MFTKQRSADVSLLCPTYDASEAAQKTQSPLSSEEKTSIVKVSKIAAGVTLMFI